MNFDSFGAKSCLQHPHFLNWFHSRLCRHASQRTESVSLHATHRVAARASRCRCRRASRRVDSSSSLSSSNVYGRIASTSGKCTWKSCAHLPRDHQHNSQRRAASLTRQQSSTCCHSPSTQSLRSVKVARACTPPVHSHRQPNPHRVGPSFTQRAIADSTWSPLRAVVNSLPRANRRSSASKRARTAATHNRHAIRTNTALPRKLTRLLLARLCDCCSMHRRHWRTEFDRPPDLGRSEAPDESKLSNRCTQRQHNHTFSAPACTAHIWRIASCQ